MIFTLLLFSSFILTQILREQLAFFSKQMHSAERQHSLSCDDGS